MSTDSRRASISDEWMSPYFDDVPSAQVAAFARFAEPGATKTVECDGRPVPYVDRGTGRRVLLFCHGAFVRGDMFHAVIRQLADRYRVIAPTFSGEFHHVARAVAAIERIRETEKLDSFTVVGYSFGGAIAQYLMLEHPEWLDGVVLSHTTNLFRSVAPGKIRRAARVVGLMPSSLIRKRMSARRRKYPVDLPWSKFHNAYFEEAMSRLRKRDLVAWLKGTARLAAELRGTAAPTFAGPILILATDGDQDTFGAMPELQEAYPHADSHVFREAGGHHSVFLHPESYARVIGEWLASRIVAGSAGRAGES